jgi:hypothetical protein
MPSLTVALEFVLTAVLIGVGASALMDLWSLVLRRRFHVPTLDYAMLGRWVGHLGRGRYRHERIAQATPIPGERPLGWLVHYAIGVTFAFPLLAIWGLDWAHAPTIWPALFIGLATIAGPWLVMQPGMGAGIAGSRTPNPRATRLRNLGTHTVYGVGLYASAMALALVSSGLR